MKNIYLLSDKVCYKTKRTRFKEISHLDGSDESRFCGA